LAVLARPFDPAADWTWLNDAMRFLAGAIGPFSAIGCLAASIIFCTSLVIMVTKSVQRWTEAAAQHNLAASRAIVWLPRSGSAAQCSAPTSFLVCPCEL
jgi:hypothetical protein